MGCVQTDLIFMTQATISVASVRRPIIAQSVALIAKALTRVPAIKGIDSLIRRDGIA